MDVFKQVFHQVAPFAAQFKIIDTVLFPLALQGADFYLKKVSGFRLGQDDGLFHHPLPFPLRCGDPVFIRYPLSLASALWYRRTGAACI